MASIFTRIIQGELPGRFVWRDEHCVAFLTINPIRAGHTLVVPRKEVDHWLELDPKLTEHLFGVAQMLGRAIQAGFGSKKVGLSIVGLEVLHVHLHLMPIDSIADMDFARQEKNPDPQKLDAAAETIRTKLRELGFAELAQAIE
jgi:histidine triad (HIT) family protein